MPEEVREDVDWVALRLKCKSAAAVAPLAALVEPSVALRNVEGGDFGFEHNPDGNGFRVVKRFELSFGSAVYFTATADGIEISATDGRAPTPQFLARAVVTDGGAYRFNVDGVLLTDWQVCRRALERLFFGTSAR